MNGMTCAFRGARRRTLSGSVLLMLLLASCGEPQRILELNTSAPASRVVTDGAHGGNSHFYWLPPMVADPSPTGVFDAEVSPEVDICEWNGSACVQPLLATYTTTTGPGSETVRVDTTDALYIVNWHTDQFALTSGATYRITASVLGAIVGIADVAVLSTGSAKNVSTGDDIALVDGKTLPIKFRIEQGMVTAVRVSPNPATAILNKVTQVTATLTDAHGQPVTDQPVVWSSAAFATASIDASGNVTGVAVGSTTVSATSNGLVGSATVNVIPPPVASVIITPQSSTILVGQSVQLTATAKDADGNVLTGRIVTWTASPGASVDGTGLVTSNQPGTYDVTATSEGVSGSAQVLVNPAGFIAASISTGDRQNCALTATGAAYCWGANDFGQLGSGSFSPNSSNLPVPVAGGLSFVELEASSISACARTADGTAYCWGNNSNGGVGDGTGISRAAPTAVATALKFTQLTDHGGSHCGLATDGTAWCWGRNYGTLPVQISGAPTFRAIFGGGVNDCGLTTDNQAWCWGEQFGGPFPYHVGTSHVYSMLALGEHHACGLDLSGFVWCWGDNSFGAFGDGTTTGTDGAWAVPGNAGAMGMQFVSIHAGEFNTCGLTASGAAYCWGDNSNGQIGDGTTTQRLTPAAVATPLRFTSLVTGQWYSPCALTAGGAVYCWGANSDGEVGDGTLTDRLTPVRVQLPAGPP